MSSGPCGRGVPSGPGEHRAAGPGATVSPLAEAARRARGRSGSAAGAAAWCPWGWDVAGAKGLGSERPVVHRGRRPQMKALAEELGAVWVTRPDNTHAKAGNINHALTVTRGDLVLILDADHVPLPDALEDLVGYFQDPALARAQSPHDCSTTTPVNTTRWAGTSSRSSSRSSARARITTAGFPDGMGDRLGASIDRM